MTAARRGCMLFFLCLMLGGGAQAAQRTFVSTGGSDANACSLAAPCRGFAKAITATDPGGELVVLDSGGYGSVTVNKNVTILSPAGVYAGISVFAASDGVTIVAPATKVVLRGLTINGQAGNNGVRVQAGEVHVESTVISNMAQAGILVEGGTTVRISGTVSRSNVDGLRIAPTAGTVSVLVRDSEFSNNATAGIGVSPSPPVSNAMVTVERTSVTKNGAGIVAAAGTGVSAQVVVMQSVTSENTGAGMSVSGNTASVFVRESAITRNGTGLLAAAGGQLTACGANLLVANTTAQSGGITVNAAACLDQLAGGTGTVTSVGTGTGLTGGPITTSGTLSADTAYLQRRVSTACAVGSSIRAIAADGSVTCQADGNSGGTVTSVGTGAGLTGGPITATGTINLATTQLLPTVACTNGQVPNWNGSAWACGNPGTFAGNITLQESTSSSVGNIMKGAAGFIHNYGIENTFIGELAGNFTMTGGSNSAIGFAALSVNQFGAFNTANGAYALFLNSDGTYNNASGTFALNSNTNGSYNNANGAYALYSNTIGSYNNAGGSYALSSNTTGINNTSFGHAALTQNTTGSDNTAIGYGALPDVNAQSRNTALGSGATVGGSNATAIGVTAFANGDNATAIGFQANADASNHVRIGNTSVTQIGGQVAWSNLSDRRDKKDIADSSLGLDFVTALRPVQFKLLGGNDRIDFGFIAQDVEALIGMKYNVLGIGRTTERKLSLRYADFIAPMVKAIQQQQAMIERQAGELAALREAHAGEMAELRRSVETLLALTQANEKVAARNR